MLDARPAASSSRSSRRPRPASSPRQCKNEYYDTDGGLSAALAEALRVEYEAIVEHGFLLQLDCPTSPSNATSPIRTGRSPTSWASSSASSPRSTARSRTSRASASDCTSAGAITRAPHDSDVPLAEILPIIRRRRSAASCFPFANPRHAHEYHCFDEGRALDDDQVLVAGVIDTLTNFVEHPEVVAERIERVAAAVGDPRRVLAGTDCGFDTSAGMGRVAEDVVWAKLRALRDGARLASERLF